MKNIYHQPFESMLFMDNYIEHGGLRTQQSFKNNQNNKPLISIITVVLNGEKYLEECILSLHNQKFKNYEHIILDGGSADKTLEIIKKYENKIDYCNYGN